MTATELRDEVVKRLEAAAEQQRIFATGCSSTPSKKGFLRAAAIIQEEADRLKKLMEIKS